ncbi:MAG TPA: glucokinase [Myxococcales bacterium]|jgi:glucokinase|nr:glucokinase [Myxococcales bacterium]
MQVLAGDVGGTKTLLAIVEVGPPGPSGAPSIELRESLRFDSRQYQGLAAICRVFAAELGRPVPAHAAFGVAGPVSGGRAHTTNLPWVLDERELASVLGIQSVQLTNDFHALALGIPAVRPKDLVTLNEGARNPRGPSALIGAGTGLGEAIAVLDGSGRREVLASEGGHTSFAPRDEWEIGILRFLLQRYEHVSWERVLSGDGLVNLAEAVAHLTGAALPAQVARTIREAREEAPAAVTDAARTGDSVCRRAVETFCSLYGAEAGNLALKILATGGVYVAGGIAPKLLPQLQDGRFRDAFLSKGRMRPLLETMPVQVVLDPNTTVLGAAALAAAKAILQAQTRQISATTP